MSVWNLPKTAVFGGVEYKINADFRDVLEVIRYLNDQSKTIYTRWRIAVALFFDGEIPEEYQEEAAQYIADFIAYETKDDKPCPKLLDWEQDAQMIITEVNNVAGRELRGEAFVHWWTFLSYFNAMRAENPLHMIMAIRSKKAKGQQLDKSERKYYSENREKVDFQTPETAKIAEEKAYLEKWL